VLDGGVARARRLAAEHDVAVEELLRAAALVGDCAGPVAGARVADGAHEYLRLLQVARRVAARLVADALAGGQRRLVARRVGGRDEERPELGERVFSRLPARRRRAGRALKRRPPGGRRRARCVARHDVFSPLNRARHVEQLSAGRIHAARRVLLRRRF
jgi:hypothetical protein